MNKMRSGQLIWKKEIEHYAGPLKQEITGKVSFVVQTKVKGIQAPVEVRVFANVIEEEFLQLWDYTVEYASVSLGEKRTELLCEELQQLLYTKEEFFAPIEHKDFYIYGYHYAFSSHYGTRSAAAVKRKESKTFELLAEETTERLGETRTFRYYYDPIDQLLLEHATPNAWDEEWKTGKQKHVLYDLQSRNGLVTYQIVDEVGRIYQALRVEHPDAIRLFQLKRTGRSYEIHTPSGLHRHMQKSTYQEALEVQALNEDRKAIPFTGTLPHRVGAVTIHSPRVVGDVLSNYPVGTWVETTSGKMGVTITPREGKAYGVCFESDYLPGLDDVLHNQVKEIDNPCHVFEDEQRPIARFRLETARFVYGGFGYILEERPSVYKIKPVSKFEEGVALTVQGFVIDDLRLHRRRRDEAIKQMNAIYGSDLDFLLIPKSDVTLLSEDEIIQWQTFIADADASNEQKVFENLLQLQSVHRFNWDYVVMELLDYTKFDTMTDIVKKLTDFMVHPQEKTFVHALFKWFDKMAIKKRILTS